MKVRDLLATCTAVYGKLPIVYKMSFGEYIDVSDKGNYYDDLVDAWRVGTVQGSTRLLIWVK